MAKTVVILQPGYLPWLGFFDQLRQAEVFVIYDDVQFDKHGWRNRNRIKSPAGPVWLTVPVRHTGRSTQRILDVEIDGRTPWAKKHIGTVAQHYGHAPFIKRYLPELAELLHRPWERLVDLDLGVVRLLAGWLGIEAPLVRSSELGITGERSERLVTICQHFGATRYLSGSAARAYLDEALFARAGIEVAWHDYVHPVYSQQHGAFISHLSALDLLLNCGEQSAAILTGALSGERMA